MEKTRVILIDEYCDVFEMSLTGEQLKLFKALSDYGVIDEKNWEVRIMGEDVKIIEL